MAGVSITTTDLPASAQAYYYPDGNFSSSSLSTRIPDARPESPALPAMDLSSFLPPTFPTRGESLANHRLSNHDRSDSTPSTPTGASELEASPVRQSQTSDLAPRIPSAVLNLNWHPPLEHSSSSTAPSTHGIDDFMFDDQHDSASTHTGISSSRGSHVALVLNIAEEPKTTVVKEDTDSVSDITTTAIFPLPPPPRKHSVVTPPTSRFNRKPVGSVTGIPKPQTDPYPTPSLEDAPPPTPVLSLLPKSTYTPAPDQNLTALPTPPPPSTPSLTASSSSPRSFTTPPTPNHTYLQNEAVQQLKAQSLVKSTKSTASERRKRALHSHPSDIPTRPSPAQASDDAEHTTRPTAHRRSSRKSTDSRATTPRSTIYDGQIPSPAPTAPLPELPAHARTPSTKEVTTSKRHGMPVEAPVPSPRGSLPAPRSPGPALGRAHESTEQEHIEMANFMTSTNRIVFRRFDDVHVRLLLFLQDEISQLEADLLKFESRDSTSPDAYHGRMRILRELRKTVGEYDQLFATWSQMQANKANDSVLKALKSWLEKPSTSAGAGLGKDAKEDLEWLSKSTDLSSISLGPQGSSSDDSVGPSEKITCSGTQPNNSHSPAAGGFSLAAMFGCANKRK